MTIVQLNQRSACRFVGKRFCGKKVSKQIFIYNVNKFMQLSLRRMYKVLQTFLKLKKKVNKTGNCLSNNAGLL